MWDYLHIEMVLNNLASIVTILSLGIAPFVYFWKKNLDEKSERKRASENLYIELNDALDGSDASKHDDLKIIKTKDKKLAFMNRRLNHDFYDSLVSSGKINFLTSELQQPIQDTVLLS